MKGIWDKFKLWCRRLACNHDYHLTGYSCVRYKRGRVFMYKCDKCGKKSYKPF